MDAKIQRLTQALPLSIAESEQPTGASSTPNAIVVSLVFTSITIPMRHISLVLLVAQTVGAVIFLRISRTHQASNIANGVYEPAYLASTAVLFSEVLKLILSTALVFRDAQYSRRATLAQFRSHIVQHPLQTIKVGIPAILYTIQNTLIIVALSHVSATVYQVTYQLKILTTAVWSVLLLRRSLSLLRWSALVTLMIGVALTQTPTQTNSLSSIHGNRFVGVTAILLACMTSGLSGVYFEKVLKNSPHVSVWMRNVQLALLGSILALIGVFWTDGSTVLDGNIFQGYSPIVWLVICLQGAGGLIVAAVLKYADNISKCVANALSIIISMCCERLILPLHSEAFTPMRILGIFIVILSSYSYAMDAVSLPFFKSPRNTCVETKRNGLKQRDRALSFTTTSGALQHTAASRVVHTRPLAEEVVVVVNHQPAPDASPPQLDFSQQQSLKSTRASQGCEANTTKTIEPMAHPRSD